MGSEKGFTLIELLAVIVILAIIALIATPIIMNVINDSKKGAFKDTAYGIIKSGELYYSTNLVKGAASQIVFNFPNDSTVLNFKGDTLGGGTLKINSNGEISIAIYDKGKNWCVTRGANDSDVTISKYVEGDCKIAVAATDEDCFEFSNGVITNYKCGYYTGDRDSNDNPVVNTGKVITDVVIPEKINGQPVTEIASYQYGQYPAKTFAYKGLTSVTFPKTITTIGAASFSDNKITGVIDLGDAINLTNLGEGAFEVNEDFDYRPSLVILPNKMMTYIDQRIIYYIPLKSSRFIKGDIPISDIIDDYRVEYYDGRACNPIKYDFANIIEETDTYITYDRKWEPC